MYITNFAEDPELRLDLQVLYPFLQDSDRLLLSARGQQMMSNNAQQVYKVMNTFSLPHTVYNTSHIFFYTFLDPTVPD